LNDIITKAIPRPDEHIMIETLLPIGIAQSLFALLFVLTKRPLSVQNKILTTWLLFITALLSTTLAFELSPNFLDYNWFLLGLNFVTFPSFLYLYVKYTRNQEVFQRQDWLHATPLVIIFLLIVLEIYLISDTNSTNNLFHLQFVICTNIFSLIYFSKTLKIIKRYNNEIENNLSYNSMLFNLKWVKHITFGFGFALVLFMVFGLLIKLNIHSGLKPKTVLILLHVLFVYVICFFDFKRQQFEMNFKESEQQLTNTKNDNKNNSYKRTGLKDDDIKLYLQKLEVTMKKDEMWKNPRLVAQDIADLTNIPKHYITQILNTNLNKNFYTFVNEYRTEKAKEMLISDKHKSWSIVAIAYECGFNSKSSFNNFFKKHTGLTPSEFKNNNSNNCNTITAYSNTKPAGIIRELGD
jgi:AraC-like DNA-binding protein